MRRLLAAAGGVGLIFSSGCAAFGSASDRCGYPASASSAFPSSSVEDWVTYGDHAVVLRGVEELDQDGRRAVRLRHDHTLWSRAQAPAAPPADTFAASEQSYDAAAAEPGHDYLLVGTWWDDEQDQQPAWVHLELLAFDGGVAGHGSAGCPPGPPGAGSGRAAVWGRSEADITDLLNRTPPDPASVRFQSLEPDERWQRVAATR